MPFGFKFGGKREQPVPEWASFFTPDRYDAFLQDVDGYFRRAGSTIEHEAGTPRITVSGGNFPAGQYGLLNVAQVCNMCERDEWPQRIADHFDSLVAAQLDRAQFGAKEAEFEQIKDLLAVRIGDESGLPTDILCFRRDLPGTISYLVLDLPHSVEGVSTDLPKKWRKSIDELFLIALDNVFSNVKADTDAVEIEPGVAFTAYAGDSFFVASLALMLDRLPDALGRHGSLVSVPHRHTMLCHPIERIDVVQVIPHMAAVTQQLDREGPGSISPRLYWHHAGKFDELPCKIEGQNFDFFPPAEFIEMLNGLAAS
jgi:hypothetical protein